MPLRRCSSRALPGGAQLRGLLARTRVGPRHERRERLQVGVERDQPVHRGGSARSPAPRRRSAAADALGQRRRPRPPRSPRGPAPPSRARVQQRVLADRDPAPRRADAEGDRLDAGRADVEPDDDLGGGHGRRRSRSTGRRTTRHQLVVGGQRRDRGPRGRVRTASGSGPAASATSSSARGSSTGAPAPRRWQIQAASTRTAPCGMRPAARSAPQHRQDPDRQLLRAVGGDLGEQVAHARVREALEQRRRDSAARSSAGSVRCARRLVPPLLEPRRGTSSSATARRPSRGRGPSRRRRAASGRR